MAWYSPRDVVRSGADSIRNAAHSTADSIRNPATSTVESIRNAGSSAVESTRNAGTSAIESIRNRPWLLQLMLGGLGSLGPLGLPALLSGMARGGMGGQGGGGGGMPGAQPSTGVMPPTMGPSTGDPYQRLMAYLFPPNQQRAMGPGMSQMGPWMSQLTGPGGYPQPTAGNWMQGSGGQMPSSIASPIAQQTQRMW